MVKSNSGFLAGFQEVIITGPIGTTALAGYGGLKKHAQGINDDLKATCAVIKKDDTVVALVSLDLAGLLPTTISNIKQLAVKLTHGAIPPSNILIACTHTHSAPDTLGIFQPGQLLQYLPDKEYLAILTRNVAGAILGAFNKLKEVSITAGSKNLFNVTSNRRTNLQPNPKFPRTIDPEIQALIFKNDDEIIGIISNFTAHGTSFPTGRTLLQSADYVGVIRDEISKHYDKEIPNVYLNGACGDIAPRPYNLDSETPIMTIRRENDNNSVIIENFIDFCKSTEINPKIFETIYREHIITHPKSRFNAVEASISLDEKLGNLIMKFKEKIPPINSFKRLMLVFFIRTRKEPGYIHTGKQIASKIIEIIQIDKPLLGNGILRSITKEVRLDIDDEEMANEGLFEDMIHQEGENYYSIMNVQVIEIGDAVIATLPGEAVSQIQLRLKKIIKTQAGKKYVLISAITNGEIGYILTPEEFDLAGYESMICFGRENAYHLEKGLVELISELSSSNISWNPNIELPAFNDKKGLKLKDIIKKKKK